VLRILLCGLGLTCSLLSAAGPEFEVASVKMLSADPDTVIENHVASLNVEPGRTLNFANITLRDLIMLAYGVGAPQVSGPDSIRIRYDVIAKVPGDAKKDQVPGMLQQLLADRFKLQFHREQKTIPIFALEIAKGGPKMQAVAEGDNGPAGCDRSFAERAGATLAASCHRLDAAAIAQQVQALAPGYFREGPIIDMTGLKGAYNFKLEWVTRAEATAGSEGPSMINAVQDQLGLKLTPRKQALEILVIDRVEKQPTEN
jgi:uncharacterized protein (TIGR03435 family)